MQVFRDLSVGRKLAFSAGVAVLLMGGLVALVSYESGQLDLRQEAERRAAEARMAGFDTARLVLEANNAQRGVLLANQPDRLQAEASVMDERLGGAEARLRQASELAAAGAAAPPPPPLIPPPDMPIPEPPLRRENAPELRLGLTKGL